MKTRLLACLVVLVIVLAFKNAGNTKRANIHPNSSALDSVTQLLRFVLYVDQYDYDDIVIGFNSGASAA